MTHVNEFFVSDDGKTAYMLMSIDDKSETAWHPVVYGNMDPNKPYPVIMRLPINGELYYFVEDDLSNLAHIHLRSDRVFTTMQDAIDRAEELSNDEEWIAGYQKNIESVLSKDGTSVKQIVAGWLDQNGYEGLVNVEAECGCSKSDLFVCGDCQAGECVCAYKGKSPDGEFDEWFYVNQCDAEE